MSIATSGETGPAGIIRTRLLSPERVVTVAELAEHWFFENITLTIEGYGKLVADRRLPGRLRGAFGKALMAGASEDALAGKPCSFDPPSAFEALFRKQGRMTQGLDFPSPWVIGVAAHGGDLKVTLSLFGFAVEWTLAAAEAFMRVARELVDWKGKNTFFLPKQKKIDRVCQNFVGVSYPATPEGVELQFVSPLVQSTNAPTERPASLITGLGERLSGLARWHDVSLDDRVYWQTVRSVSQNLRYEFEDNEDDTWNRHSFPQKRTIPMKGMLCRLQIVGDLTQIAPILALGETCHMGADVAFGCGRYKIIQWYAK